MRISKNEPRDGGLTVIYVAISLLMIMGAGAVAVDGGMMWRERRDLVADVDSAALAGGEVAANFNCTTGTSAWTTLASTHPVYLAALEMLTENQGSAPEPSSFTVDLMCLNSEQGKIRVNFVGALDPFFASVYGFSELDVMNESIVQFEPIKNGMRPISMCVDDGSEATNTVNEQWLASAAGTKLTTSLQKTWKNDDFGIANGCGAGGSGTWGWICYDTSASPNPCNSDAMDDMLFTGWPWDLRLGDEPPDTRPPYTGIEENSLPLNGWSDYDCQVHSSESSGGPNDACDARTSDQNDSKIQNAINKLNCDFDDFGNLITPRPATEDCDYVFPIMGIWELAGTGATAVLKPSAFIVVTIRYPSYIKNPSGSEPGGTRACQDVANHPTSSTWLNDPPTWDNNKTCLTFELVDVLWSRALSDYDFIGTDTRLCGVAGDGGDRCDW